MDVLSDLLWGDIHDVWNMEPLFQEPSQPWFACLAGSPERHFFSSLQRAFEQVGSFAVGEGLFTITSIAAGQASWVIAPVKDGGSYFACFDLGFREDGQPMIIVLGEWAFVTSV